MNWKLWLTRNYLRGEKGYAVTFMNYFFHWMMYVIENKELNHITSVLRNSQKLENLGTRMWANGDQSENQEMSHKASSVLRSNRSPLVKCLSSNGMNISHSVFSLPWHISWVFLSVIAKRLRGFWLLVSLSVLTISIKNLHFREIYINMLFFYILIFSLYLML